MVVRAWVLDFGALGCGFGCLWVPLRVGVVSSGLIWVLLCVW